MTPEQLQQLIDALAAQGGAVDKLNQKLQDLTNSQLDLIAAQNQSATAAEQRVVTAAQKEIDARQRTMTALNAQEAAMRRSLETMAESSSKTKAKNDLIDIEIEKLKLLTQSEDANTEAGKRAIEEMAKKIKQLGEQKKALEKHQKAVDDLTDSFGALFSGTAPEIGSLLNAKNLKAMADKFKDVNGGVAGFIKAGAPMFAMQFATAIAKLAVELGDAENAFMKSTGASRDFARSLSVTYEEGRKFTATAEDMGGAMTSLYNTFTDFSTIQDTEVRNSLIKTTALLEKFGVSNEQTAQGIQTLTKGMGMNAEAAGKEMLNMVGFAQELGVAPEVLAGQFGEASDSLMKLGENGDEAFRDLAAAAKVTGLSVSKLLNIVNQFDTFEGAARQAGKLNAALGGNFVNAMDLMMETDPTARFEMIRDSILDTGLSFDTMSYYQKNFYKDAMGLESVGDLAMALSGSLESVSDETKMMTKDYEDAAKEARELASFQDQLNAAFKQLIPILSPLIDAFRGILTFIGENITMFKILGGVLLVAFGGIPGIVIAVISLLDAIKLGTDKVSLLSVVFEGIAEGVKPLIEGLNEVGQVFLDAMGHSDLLGESGDNLIPMIRDLVTWFVKFGTLVTRYAIIPFFKMFAFILGKVAWGVKELMTAFAEKNSPSFFDMFTSGLLAKSLGILKLSFGPVIKAVEFFGGAIDSVIAKIVAMVEKMGEMKDAVANSWAAQVAIKGYNMVTGGGEEPPTSKAQMPGKPVNNNVMNKTMATTAAAVPAAAARAAAPTAASTNIAQNSSSSTYINSGPKEIITEVKIGNESIKRIVHKTQDQRAAKAIAGRS